jgi:UDP-glucuronate 4-epimerase
MKLLVTGAAGFISFHTSQLLRGRGDEVVGLDNLNDSYDVPLKEARRALLPRHPSFRFVKTDLAGQGGSLTCLHGKSFYWPVSCPGYARF